MSDSEEGSIYEEVQVYEDEFGNYVDEYGNPVVLNGEEVEVIDEEEVEGEEEEVADGEQDGEEYEEIEDEAIEEEVELEEEMKDKHENSQSEEEGSREDRGNEEGELEKRKYDEPEELIERKDTVSPGYSDFEENQTDTESVPEEPLDASLAVHDENRHSNLPFEEQEKKQEMDFAQSPKTARELSQHYETENPQENFENQEALEKEETEHQQPNTAEDPQETAEQENTETQETREIEEKEEKEIQETAEIPEIDYRKAQGYVRGWLERRRDKEVWWDKQRNRLERVEGFMFSHETYLSALKTLSRYGQQRDHLISIVPFARMAVTQFFRTISQMCHIHEELEERLRKRWAVWPSRPCVGDILSHTVDRMGVYIDYHHQYEQLKESLQALPEVDGDLPLGMLLLLPLGILPEYREMLRALCANTLEGHSDGPLVDRALRKVEEWIELLPSHSSLTFTSPKRSLSLPEVPADLATNDPLEISAETPKLINLPPVPPEFLSKEKERQRGVKIPVDYLNFSSTYQFSSFEPSPNSGKEVKEISDREINPRIWIEHYYAAPYSMERSMSPRYGSSVFEENLFTSSPVRRFRPRPLPSRSAPGVSPVKVHKERLGELNRRVDLLHRSIGS